MKTRLLRFLIIVVLITALSVSLAGCGEEQINSDALSCTFILLDANNRVVATFDKETNSKYLAGVIAELKTDNGNKFDCDVSGGYMSSFTYDGTVYGNAERSEYVLFYSDIEDSSLTNPVWGTVSTGGKTYASCAVGIAEMPVREDATYVFAVQALE